MINKDRKILVTKHRTPEFLKGGFTGIKDEGPGIYLRLREEGRSCAVPLIDTLNPEKEFELPEKFPYGENFAIEGMKAISDILNTASENGVAAGFRRNASLDYGLEDNTRFGFDLFYRNSLYKFFISGYPTYSVKEIGTRSDEGQQLADAVCNFSTDECIYVFNDPSSLGDSLEFDHPASGKEIMGWCYKIISERFEGQIRFKDKDKEYVPPEFDEVMQMFETAFALFKSVEYGLLKTLVSNNGLKDDVYSIAKYLPKCREWLTGEYNDLLKIHDMQHNDAFLKTRNYDYTLEFIEGFVTKYAAFLTSRYFQYVEQAAKALGLDYTLAGLDRFLSL
jgi:hypothetical protein